MRLGHGKVQCGCHFIGGLTDRINHEQVRHEDLYTCRCCDKKRLIVGIIVQAHQQVQDRRGMGIVVHASCKLYIFSVVCPG